MVNEDLKECKIIDVAVPWDSLVRSNEREKTEKYGHLKREVAVMWSSDNFNEAARGQKRMELTLLKPSATSCNTSSLNL